MTTNTNKFFETKDQYLAFRAAFATAQNSPRAKKGKPMPPFGHRNKGWLTASHFMVLNVVRGLPLLRGFTPVTNAIKLANGASTDLKLRHWQAIAILTNLIRDANRFVDNKPEELFQWEIPKAPTLLDKLNPWKTEVMARQREETIAKLIQEKTKKRQDLLKTRLDKFLEPFDNTLTIACLARLGELK